jgi:hypothetical protein
MFTFPAFLSVAWGAEGFVVEPVGVVFDLRDAVIGVVLRAFRILLRERLTGHSGRVKA